MSRVIGEWYSEAEQNHNHTVNTPAGEVEIHENEWDESYTVVQQVPETRHVDSTEDLRDMFSQFLTDMACIESLGHEVVHCDDGAVFWEKSKKR